MTTAPHRATNAGPLPPLGPGYWELAQRPWPSLVLMLPLIVLYEIGTAMYVADPDTGTTRYVYARSLLADLFQHFGVSAVFLPGVVVAAVLIGWHLARKDPWRFPPSVLFWMAIESLAMALPLFVFAVVLFRVPVSPLHGDAAPAAMVLAQAATSINPPPPTALQQIIFSIGAGIYEELLFRLLAITVLHALLVDVFRIPHKVGNVLVIVLASVLFSLYHFSAGNPFEINRALYYFGAGMYFAAIFVIRGFGIVATTHAFFDIMVELLKHV